MASSHLMLNFTPATNEAGTTGLADKGSSASFYPASQPLYSIRRDLSSRVSSYPRSVRFVPDKSPVRKEGLARIPEGVARIPRDCPGLRGHAASTGAAR